MTFPNSKVFNVQKDLVTVVSFEIEPKSGDRLTVGKENYFILGCHRTFNQQGKCSLEVSVTNEKNLPSFKGEERVHTLNLSDSRNIEARTWS